MEHGTVKWFSNEGDHGYVSPDDGGQDLHVRREYVVGDGAESLKKGDRVTYETSQEARGLWATNVSKERPEDHVRLEEDEEAVQRVYKPFGRSSTRYRESRS
jgi:cold shock protein